MNHMDPADMQKQYHSLVAGKQLFFITRKNDAAAHLADYSFYAAHGVVDGAFNGEECIQYDEAVHARKFRSEQEAQEYIDTLLPVWARACHQVVSRRITQFWTRFYTEPFIELYKAMLLDMPITDAMLAPTDNGRLRICRI